MGYQMQTDPLASADSLTDRISAIDASVLSAEQLTDVERQEVLYSTRTHLVQAFLALIDEGNAA
jgi:hypothetical protein